MTTGDPVKPVTEPCQRPGCETPHDRVRLYLNGRFCYSHQPRMLREGTPHPAAPPTGLVRMGEQRRYGGNTRPAQRGRAR